MNASPLQLKWIKYPRINLETKPADELEGPNDLIIENLAIDTNYDLGGNHMVSIGVTAVDPAKERITVDVQAFCIFSFDDSIMQDWLSTRPSDPFAAASFFARNAANLLFGSIREVVAAVSGRMPYGEMMLPPVVIDESQITIGSADSAEDEVLKRFFTLVDSETKPVTKKRASKGMKKK